MHTKKQKAAFDKLSKLKVGALFMEMGTGKTRVALDLIASKAHKIEYILWLCPFSAKDEIINEKGKWHPELSFDIVGIESIGRSDRIYLNILDTVKNKKSFIVVDESLKIKNRDAIQTNRIIRLGTYAEYKLILNGTPISKNVLDLWTQMEFLSPKILNMSFSEFKNTYCEYYIRGHLKGQVKKQHNIKHLISLIEPYIFDCDLDMGLQKHYYNYNYSLININEYEDVKSLYIDRLLDNDYFDEVRFYEMAVKLQQIYCRDKGNLLQELINSIGEPVIVFVRYLEGIPSNSLSITGNTKNRGSVIEEFKNRGGVLYITYGCGAYSLNLQFCKNIIFAEHWFDYAQREQAEARIFRTGQKYDVNYYGLWCNTGLEQLIHKSIDKKCGLLDTVKKEIRLGSDKEWLKNI